jgi:hypothetical protein
VPGYILFLKCCINLSRWLPINLCSSRQRDSRCTAGENHEDPCSISEFISVKHINHGSLNQRFIRLFWTKSGDKMGPGGCFQRSAWSFTLKSLNSKSYTNECNRHRMMLSQICLNVHLFERIPVVFARNEICEFAHVADRCKGMKKLLTIEG